MCYCVFKNQLLCINMSKIALSLFDDAKVRIYLFEYQVFKRFLPTISSRKQSGEIRQNYSLQRTLAKGRKWSEENSLSHQHQQNIPS